MPLQSQTHPGGAGGDPLNRPHAFPRQGGPSGAESLGSLGGEVGGSSLPGPPLPPPPHLCNGPRRQEGRREHARGLHSTPRPTQHCENRAWLSVRTLAATATPAAPHSYTSASDYFPICDQDTFSVKL